MKASVECIMIIGTVLLASCRKTDLVAEVLAAYDGEYELQSVSLTDYDADVDINGDGTGHSSGLVLEEIKGLSNYKNENSVFTPSLRSGRVSLAIPTQNLEAQGEPPYGYTSEINVAGANEQDLLFFSAEMSVNKAGRTSWGDVANPYNNPDDPTINRSLIVNPSIVSPTSDQIVFTIGGTVIYDFISGSLIKTGVVYTFAHVH